MNLKDRLENLNKINVISSNKEDYIKNFNADDFFEKDKELEDFILQCLNENKNIIYLIDNSADSMTIAYYLKSIASNINIEFIRNVDDINDLSSDICILPSPAVKEIVKLFEYTVYGYKSFIFGLKLKNLTNITEKLQAVLAVNFPNLTSKNINTLISSADLVYVFISKNAENLYYIKEISRLNYKNNEFYTEPVFQIKYEKQKKVNTEEFNDCIDDEISEKDIKLSDTAEDFSENNLQKSLVIDVKNEIENELPQNFSVDIDENVQQPAEEKEIETDCINKEVNVEETDLIQKIEITASETEPDEKNTSEINIEKNETQIIPEQNEEIQENKNTEKNNINEIIENETKSEEVQSVNSDENSLNEETFSPELKVNKYKLLKEKIKNKQQNI